MIFALKRYNKIPPLPLLTVFQGGFRVLVAGQQGVLPRSLTWVLEDARKIEVIFLEDI